MKTLAGQSLDDPMFFIYQVGKMALEDQELVFDQKKLLTRCFEKISLNKNSTENSDSEPALSDIFENDSPSADIENIINIRLSALKQKLNNINLFDNLDDNMSLLVAALERWCNNISTYKHSSDNPFLIWFGRVIARDIEALKLYDENNRDALLFAAEVLYTKAESGQLTKTDIDDFKRETLPYCINSRWLNVSLTLFISVCVGIMAGALIIPLVVGPSGVAVFLAILVGVIWGSLGGLEVGLLSSAVGIAATKFFPGLTKYNVVSDPLLDVYSAADNVVLKTSPS